jgi:hypothetical protein
MALAIFAAPAPAPAPAPAQAAHADACTGIWAAQASPPTGRSTRPMPVIAPHGRARLEADPGLDQLRFVGPSGRGELLQVYGAEGDALIDPNQGLTEVMWAPDAKHFAVNASDGGLVGSWNATVFAVREGRPYRLPPLREVQLAANRLARCEAPESANLGVAAWLKGGAEMLVVAQVPPHSSCRNMGELHGWRVATASGRILESLSHAAMRRRWGDALGCNAR